MSGRLGLRKKKGRKPAKIMTERICLLSFLVHIRDICADEVFEYWKGILLRISLLSAAPLLMDAQIYNDMFRSQVKRFLRQPLWKVWRQDRY